MDQGFRNVPGLDNDRRRTQVPDQDANAKRAVDNAIEREGSQSQIESLLDSMEIDNVISGDIVQYPDEIHALHLADGQVSDQTDCEMDSSDEDESTRGESCDYNSATVTGDGKWDEESPAFDESSKFEILVNVHANGEVSCSVKKDPRTGFYSNSKVADQLDELGSRYDVLARIGEWLSENRDDFLRFPKQESVEGESTCNWWNYADKALEEAKTNKASVVQKDFISIANLPCDAGLFSRYKGNVVLAWNKNGFIMPLSNLFSKDAKRAWVARAFRDACHEAYIDDMDRAVKILQQAKRKKAKVKDNPLSFLNSADWELIESAAGFLCGLAQVGGASVVASFGDKMKGV